MKRQNEQQKNGKLKSLVRDSELELSQEKAQVDALEETHERLQQAEGLCQELADENRRLRKKISEWQERLSKTEKDDKELITLQQQLDDLQSEHAQLIKSNRELQQKLTALTESGKISTTLQSDTTGAIIPEIKANMASDGAGSTDDHPVLATDPIAEAHVIKERKPIQTICRFINRNWQLSVIFGGVVVVMMLGTVTVKLLKSEALSSSPAVSASQETTVEEAARPVSKPSSIAAPRIQGAFQTIRPTQVFSEPSEESALIANIKTGTKLNVVDSRDGWLEVRSKHGRPPGFVRQEATARVSSN